MTRLAATAAVRCKLDELAEILSHRPADWLRPFLRIAYHEGEALATRLEAKLGPVRLAKRIVVHLGDPFTDDGSVVVPLRWEAAGYRALFPVFEGRFVLRPLSREFTEVAVEGAYDPPGGLLGDIVDRSVAHRAAERSVVNLLDNLRAAIESRATAEGRVAGA